MSDENITRLSMADHTERDIKLAIDKGVQTIPGLSQTERAEIADAVKQKTGHQIRYVKGVALPFLHTSLQRSVQIWIKDWPEDVNGTYLQHLHQLLRPAIVLCCGRL